MVSSYQYLTDISVCMHVAGLDGQQLSIFGGHICVYACLQVLMVSSYQYLAGISVYMHVCRS